MFKLFLPFLFVLVQFSPEFEGKTAIKNKIIKFKNIFILSLDNLKYIYLSSIKTFLIIDISHTR